MYKYSISTEEYNRIKEDSTELLYIRQKKTELNSKVSNHSTKIPRSLIMSEKIDDNLIYLKILKIYDISYFYRNVSTCFINISIYKKDIETVNENIKNLKDSYRDCNITISNVKDIYETVSLYYFHCHPSLEIVLSNRLAKNLICKHKNKLQSLRADFKVVNVYNDEDQFPELKKIFSKNFPSNFSHLS